MSKIYNEDKIIKLDPLSSKLDDAGFKGGVAKRNAIKLKNFKKKIQKIPNKSIVSGKKNKEKAIKEQTSIAGKMTAKGDEYLPPFRKGGRAMLKGGGICKKGMNRKAVGKNS